jgi:serine/threonine protein kinase/Tol biopolymer transport system component
MTLAAGTRLGPYEILSPLGAGGMGEVYRARDTRLERTVAVKVLPPRLSASPESRQRFEREAKTISQLSHPHICAVHDVGREGETEYLVMEYLEGETLSARLANGPLPVEQVLRYGTEIADALDKAHRQGIVHRDLKPGNVMLTKSGVKLLDFGLAKVVAPPAGQTSLTALPTQQGLTKEGTILGTFQYMAPEQLEGKETDGRTDIFALGATLYEMATGKKAFTGASQASLIGAILHIEPQPMSTIEPTSPPALDRVVRKCLSKDPENRWQNAADLGSELKWIGEGNSQTGVTVGVTPRPRSLERLAWALGVLALLAGLTFALARSRRTEPSRKSIQFIVPAPEKSSFGFSFALSPDGEQLVFEAISDGKLQLWLRPLNSVEARPIAGTEGGSLPFWSPDGLYVGFFADGKLKKIALAGGTAQTIADAAQSRGGTWSPEGVILFSPGAASPLMRVSASGGAVSVVTTVDQANAETGHRWPDFLPDGRHFLFLARNTDAEREAICVGSLDSRERTVLRHARSRAIYSPPGYLLFSGEHTLMAQRFDATALRLLGEPVPLAEGIEPIGEIGPTGYVQVSASEGVLAFRREGGNRSQLTWYDRNGTSLGTLAEPGDYDEPTLSPDSTRLAILRKDPKTRFEDIWVLDLDRSTLARLTFDPSDHVYPVWSPDGKHIAFSSARPGSFGLYWKLASGAGPEQMLWKSDPLAWTNDWSRDGRFILYERLDPHTQYDLWVLPMPGPGKPSPYVVAPGLQRRGRFSPDGHWVAYTSDESGRPEIYVQAFPPTGGKWLISTDGGDQASWRADGKELVYLSAGLQLVAVEVKLGDTFEVGIHRPLFSIRPKYFIPSIALVQGNVYVMTPDGKRFLVNERVEGNPALPSIQLVANWTPAPGK